MEIALKILKNDLNISAMEITRFPIGFCHCVYYVKTKTNEYVLRVTNSRRYYDGSVKWLNELAPFDLPIPKILTHGQYKENYYTLITYIQGKDLIEVYHTLDDYQKNDIAKQIVNIQKKVSRLPSSLIDGSVNYSVSACIKNIKNKIERFREIITTNKVFNPAVCDAVIDLLDSFGNYLSEVKPVAFLDDISNKNVLIHNGELAGVVDIDEMGYGDPIEVVGFTKLALLAQKADTPYIDYWLDEMGASATQRNAMGFYLLLYCIDFMSEQGKSFENGNFVPVNQKEVDLLNTIYQKSLKNYCI
jgi:aminoglycoside phosphotransferase (APT) family kinase protein